MKARDIINPIETAFFRRKRREPPVFVIAAGVVFAAAAVAPIHSPAAQSPR